MLKSALIHSLICFVGCIFSAQTVTAQLHWYDSFESAQKAAEDKQKLTVVMQFHSHGEFSESALLREYEQQISRSLPLANWLANNATLVAESVNSKSRKRTASRMTGGATTNAQFRYCLTLFCSHEGKVVHFWVGLPSGAEILEVAKEALEILEENQAADPFDESIRTAHLDLLSKHDRKIFESILPAKAGSITAKTPDAESLTQTLDSGTTVRGDLDSLERVFVGVSAVRRQDFLNRFGAGLNKQECQNLVEDLESGTSIGTELINMMMARLPCLDLRRVDRYLWAIFANQYVKRAANTIEDLVVTARMEKRSLALRIAPNKTKFAEGLPKATELKIKQQLKDFKNGICCLEELNVVTKLLGARPVVVPLHEEIAWYLATFDGSSTEIVLKDDFEQLKTAAKRIRKANK